MPAANISCVSPMHRQLITAYIRNLAQIGYKHFESVLVRFKYKNSFFSTKLPELKFSKYKADITNYIQGDS